MVNFVPTAEGVTSDVTAECWICYDTERTDAGPMIQPCDCRGDVGAVHHHCLRKWLMEVRCPLYTYGSLHVISLLINFLLQRKHFKSHQ